MTFNSSTTRRDPPPRIPLTVASPSAPNGCPALNSHSHRKASVVPTQVRVEAGAVIRAKKASCASNPGSIGRRASIVSMTLSYSERSRASNRGTEGRVANIALDTAKL